MKYFYSIIKAIFGFDYVYWENGEYYGISRIFISKDARPCFWLSFGGERKLKELEDSNAVIWLTCSPEKYFTIKEENTEIEQSNI